MLSESRGPSAVANRGLAGSPAVPAHEYRNPSLIIRDVDGQTPVHCHAGWKQADVIGSLKRLGMVDRTFFGDARHLPVIKPEVMIREVKSSRDWSYTASVRVASHGVTRPAEWR